MKLFARLMLVLAVAVGVAVAGWSHLVVPARAAQSAVNVASGGVHLPMINADVAPVPQLALPSDAYVVRGPSMPVDPNFTIDPAYTMSVLVCTPGQRYLVIASGMYYFEEFQTSQFQTMLYEVVNVNGVLTARDAFWSNYRYVDAQLTRAGDGSPFATLRDTVNNQPVVLELAGC
jgi:hypothetical protein